MSLSVITARRTFDDVIEVTLVNDDGSTRAHFAITDDEVDTLVWALTGEES